MKLKDLNTMARRANFDWRRIHRIHSSLYRLSAGIPEKNEPIFFTSKWGCLYASLYGLEDAYVVSSTEQFCFGSWQTMPVYQF